MKSWANRIIYLVLLDRFANGDTASDDQGCGEYDPQNPEAFHGGDLKGLISKLPYIKKMGFDAIWVTPALKNQWISPSSTCRGYHGYWTENFTEIDPHFGDLNDWKKLVAKAHALGLKVIQDIVVNHTADYFTIDAREYEKENPSRAWRSYDDRFGKAPQDPVFQFNNPKDVQNLKSPIYNFTPNIQDYGNRKETLKHTLADLDDLNLESPVVRRRLQDIYKFWIEQAQVDAYRIDTVFYTPPAFYDEFVPSIKQKAKERGIDDFLMFAETWNYDFKNLNSYLQTKDGKRRLDSTIDFPLHEKLVDVFFNGAATSVFTKDLENVRIRETYWVRFLDNHDIERVFSRAPWSAIQQAFVALMTLPGLPCFYYGTEVGMKELRGDFFADSNYTGQSEQALLIKKLNKIRKKYPHLWQGKVKVLEDSLERGLLVYINKSREKKGKKSPSLLVIFNTASEERLFIPQQHLNIKKVFANFSINTKLIPRAYRIPAQSFGIFEVDESSKKPPVAPKRLKFVKAKGRLKALSAALDVHWLVNGQWRPEFKNQDLPLTSLKTGLHHIRCLGVERTKTMEQGLRWQSQVHKIKVQHKLVPLSPRSVEMQPNGGLVPGVQILPPKDNSYAGQMSIQGVTLFRNNHQVQLHLQMKDITNQWNAPYGFDHCYFTILVGLPQDGGSKTLPKVNYHKGDFCYSKGYFANGWEISSFEANKSDSMNYGGLLAGGLSVKVNAATQTLVFEFLDQDLIQLQDWSGVRLWVSTWDGYLGKFHALQEEHGDWNFSFSSKKPVNVQELPLVYSRVLLEF